MMTVQYDSYNENPLFITINRRKGTVSLEFSQTMAKVKGHKDPPPGGSMVQVDPMTPVDLNPQWTHLATI